MDPVQQVIQLEKDIKKLQIQLSKKDAEIAELKEQLMPVFEIKEGYTKRRK